MFQPIFIAGPTCVGKSGIAIKLAQKLRAEIVSCDSMQVYQGMDIGTAKPSNEEQKSAPHYMISLIPLTQEYNVALYVNDANKAIDKIQTNNKIPLVVGGTGLYMKALIDGLFSGPSGNEEIRMKLEKRIEKEGLSILYDELKKADPQSSEKIKPQDKRRIVRALEVYYVTGRPISTFQKEWVAEKKDAVIIGLNRERKDLYERIDERVERMFEDGFVNEVRMLIGQGLRENKTAGHALGYKEILNYIYGKYTLEETKELVKRNTRRFAKRQLTWFGKDKRIKWVVINNSNSIDDIVEKILVLIRGTGSPLARG